MGHCHREEQCEDNLETNPSHTMKPPTHIHHIHMISNEYAQVARLLRGHHFRCSDGKAAKRELISTP